MFSMYIHWKHI